MKLILFFLFLFYQFLFSQVLFSQDDTYSVEQEDPVWVLVEKGKAELRKKEFGNALKYFKEAIMIKEEFPGVYILIGDIYKMSDNPIAKEYYEQAYELRHFFEIPGEKYTVLYKLISLYKAEKNYKQYEALLKKTLIEDETYLSEFFDKKTGKFTDNYYTLYDSKGLNRLLILYRILDYQHVIKAHAELGWYNYKTGMYKESIIHSLFAIVGVVSEAFKEVRGIKPLYDFTTMTDFLHVALQYGYISTYLIEESDIYRLLYYLGCATYVEIGYIPAREIWKIIAQSPVPTIYKDRALMQIQSPKPEKLIDIPKDIEYEWDL